MKCVAKDDRKRVVEVCHKKTNKEAPIYLFNENDSNRQVPHSTKMSNTLSKDLGGIAIEATRGFTYINGKKYDAIKEAVDKFSEVQMTKSENETKILTDILDSDDLSSDAKEHCCNEFVTSINQGSENTKIAVLGSISVLSIASVLKTIIVQNHKTKRCFNRNMFRYLNKRKH
ncbi:hypothetical protein [Oribacterium sp. FC2011]|uniref:hypothetical protein n=1 Tax=Oribacterium sp. FC2011 TaxID=1408311 RepID=UPI0004E0EC35|nr:hypothetical protein [Oribacterium sp. FC2011]